MNTKSQVKTKAKAHTMSELVSLRGVTVGPTSVLTEEQNLKSVKTGQNNTGYYDAGALKQLWSHYVKSKPERDKTDNTQNLRT